MAIYTDAQILEAIREALYGTLSRNAKAITIGGRSLTSFSLKELMDLEKQFQTRVAEAAGAGQSAVVKFRKPG